LFYCFFMTQDPHFKKIQRALLSVSDKTGLVAFANTLISHGVEILSTGGTAKALKDAGIPVIDVSSHTGAPEIMDGRVKTLHPKIHGGILARRDNPSHLQAMQDHAIGGIDMVVVNLYPFAQTVASGADFEDVIENIDIGGPAMVRASAKNHEFVTIITSPDNYEAVAKELDNHNGATSLSLRRSLAAQAFQLTADYDRHIASWLTNSQSTSNDELPQTFTAYGTKAANLRYGENPHQSAALYLDGTKRAGVATATQIQGKELSYNNLNDTDAAFELVSEFEEPAVAIIKHANPCGVSTGPDILEAYKLALRCDPVSAFGGIIALNRNLDAVTAAEIIKIFSEVIIAPSVDDDAKAILSKKTNLRVLITGGMADKDAKRLLVKSIAGGYLVQDADTGQISKDKLRIVTKRAPTDKELDDLLFAFKVAKHVKSNAIIYAKDRSTVGIGAGQMSRIDSTRIAAQKAQDAAEAANIPHSLAQQSVVASDAFFPFADGLIAASDAGVTAIIQPGGSIRDEEVIAAADERGIAMVFTDMRHFKH
jgi:phosphoribosylaminoimidazolecarboxamide formyltransferase/IMP cyclohydrolase